MISASFNGIGGFPKIHDKRKTEKTYEIEIMPWTEVFHL
jgi:hypothetical protein